MADLRGGTGMASALALLVVAFLSACSGQEPPATSGPPLPVDTTPQKPPVADVREPVASGNTRAAADVAAIAALGASFDPNRSAANDLHAAGAGIAIPPIWPAPPVRQRLDRNPIWRIAA